MALGAAEPAARWVASPDGQAELSVLERVAAAAATVAGLLLQPE